MIFIIDTTKFGNMTFVLEGKAKQISRAFAVSPQESERILEHLEKFLRQSKIKDYGSKIHKIVVYKGQGSFTGLRIAAAIAQALSLAWQVPVKIVSAAK